MLLWIVFLGLLAAWALRSVAGQRRFAWVQMAVEEVAPWWGVNFNGCALGWTEVSHFVLVMLTKLFSSPRLETRTKESNMCASTGVANSWCAMKVTVVGLFRRHNLPAPLSWEKGLSVSIHVWTRKVATYA